MYDADYERYLEKLKGAFTAEDRFVTKDSGTMAHHSDGVVRDTQEGKTKFTLMFPLDIPMKDQLIVRIAELYTRGGEKYGDRNWEDSCAPDTLKHHTEALWRHFMSFFFEEDQEEDHAAAIVWNINAVELTRRKIREAEAIGPAERTPEELPEKHQAIYVFPYITRKSFTDGKYRHKNIEAGSYEEAKRKFDEWQQARDTRGYQGRTVNGA